MLTVIFKSIVVFLVCYALIDIVRRIISAFFSKTPPIKDDVFVVIKIKNKNDVSLFNRNLSNQITRKAVAVCGMSFIILFISTILLSVVTDASTIDVLYETVSATATVGLTRNLTSSLDIFGKIIIICTMYFGRVGPISLAVAFASKRESANIIKNPIEDISVG